MKTRWILQAAFVAAAGTAVGLPGGAHPARAQTAQPAANPAAEVREMIERARKDIDSYKNGGGAAGTPDHPAVKWDAELWNYRDRAPNAEARTMATVEAIRFLLRAELWDRAHMRVESLDASDPAWERVPSVLYYDDGSARKDYSYTIEKLSEIASKTKSASIKSSSMLALGRVHRRQGDKEMALRSLEMARDTAPGTPPATEAAGLIYEIKYLSIGLPAPAISAKARNGGVVDLAELRGKPVVLLFWGST